MYTPWGDSQFVETIAEGIMRVSTASHGGFVLSPERLKAMPERFKLNRYGTGRFFEEDCEWALVVLAFPEEFSKDQVHIAKSIALALYPSVFDLVHP